MTTIDPARRVDEYDSRVALGVGDPLAPFNQLGVLSAADIHVATRLAALAGEEDPRVVLAAALAVRAPRHSHVFADLATSEGTAGSDLESPVDLEALHWPQVGDWVDAVRASPLVADGDSATEARPLRLVGSHLYLDRYWKDERAIATDLVARSEAPVDDIDDDVLAAGLERLFPHEAEGGDLQRLASAAAVLQHVAVIAGGPGTGKTTTVARLLALLDEQAMASGSRPPRVALAAPTGKAAARLEEAVHREVRRLAVDEATRDRVLGLAASTLHRLLGWRPDSRSRFRHDRANQLPHDVVIVDETSMVSLSLMAKLIEAVRPESRLILLGDPDQLASVEAGAVLGDVVGPAATLGQLDAGTSRRLEAITGDPLPANAPAPTPKIGNGIVVLRHVHRFGGSIAALAEAIQRGDGDGVLRVLAAGDDDVRWVDVDVVSPESVSALEPVRHLVVRTASDVVAAARSGDGQGALTALGASRVLCAHRRGPYGVATWMAQVERWVRSSIDHYGDGGRWYVGRPLLVSANDYALRLYNGDTGVIVEREAGRAEAVFERRGELLTISPNRLESVETLHAMTIHKSQGSQFETVAVLLPDAASAILTRELFYTAVTRAEVRLIVVATEASVRAAVERPIARASGLGRRLWGDAG